MKQKWSPIILIAALLVGAAPPVIARNTGLPLSLLSAIRASSDESSTVKVDLISADELKAMLAKNQPVTIIDVRSTESFAESENKIKGSIHFKLRRLRSRFRFPPLRDLDRDTELVTYCSCQDDKASIRAAQILIDGGFKRVRALKGGWLAWVNARGPVQPRLK